MYVLKYDFMGFDSIAAVDLTVVVYAYPLGSCLDYEFESHCMIEGSSRGRTDKIVRCRCWIGTFFGLQASRQIYT